MAPQEDVISMTVDEVAQLCLEREEARKENDWTRADTLRDILHTGGVALDDKTHTWRMSDGTRGSYDLHNRNGAAVIDGYEQIRRLCLEREEARKNGDYDLADKIRNNLKDRGVTLEDKTHTFRTADGVTGSYDLHHGGMANGAAPNFPVGPVPGQVPIRPQHMGDPRFYPGQPMSRAVPMWDPRLGAAYGVPLVASPLAALSTGGASAIYTRRLCIQREEARKNRDYALSDRLRDELQGLGVTLDDKTHIFHCQDGASGSYDLHLLEQEPDAEKIQRLCLEREEARKRGQYDVADQIRQDLSKTMGVTLDDKTHIWRRECDNLQGSYDLHSLGASGVHSGAGAATTKPGVVPAAVFAPHGGAYVQPVARHSTASRSDFDRASRIALDREVARRNREYDKSDRMRAELQALGVTLDDKNHTFTMPDGRTGSYDLHTAEATEVPEPKRARRS